MKTTRIQFLVLMLICIFSSFSGYSQFTLTLYPNKDAQVISVAPTFNNGSSPYFSGEWQTPTQEVQSLMQFDLSSVPANSIIVSAQLTLTGYNHWPPSGSDNSCYLQKLTSSWEESTVTWNTRPGYTATSQIGIAPSTSSTQNYTMDVKSWVSDWVNGISTNYGFILKRQTSTFLGALAFNSRDCTDPTKRPKLVIQCIPTDLFTIGTGTITTPDIWSPFAYSNRNKKSQYLYFASELTAMGMKAGNIYSIAFNMSQAGPNLSTLNISLGNSNVTSLDSYVNGLTQVFSGAYTAGTGWKEVQFASPFYWDGASNLVVQSCYAESANPSGLSFAYCTSTSPPNSFSVMTTRGQSSAAATPVGCAFTDANSPQANYLRPNARFKVGRASNYTKSIVASSYNLSTTGLTNQNYTHVISSRKGTFVNTIPSTGTHDNTEISEQLNYFDGLGRPIQAIDVQASPSGKDVVKVYDYDIYGRENIKYLPYTITASSPGAYRPDALHPAVGLAEVKKFYDPAYNTDAGNLFAATNNYYSETDFEASPLNRVLKQGAPGETWQPNSHPLIFDYQVNVEQDVLLLTIGSSNELRNDYVYGRPYGNKKYYYNMDLYKKVVKDENWVSGTLNTTEEFKNKQGQVILKRSYVLMNSVIEKIETYYVYDDMGLLRYVISPEAVSQLDFSSTVNSSTPLIKNLCYYYGYDERKRLISKQLPGADVVYLVYDKRDHLVATQDGEQRGTYKWTITKYDILNRPILTGIWTTDASHNNTASVKTIVDGSAALFETRYSGTGNVHGYTCNSFPGTLTDQNLYNTVTYYDDYNALPAGYKLTDYVISGITGFTTINSSSFESSAFNRTLGKITGTKVKNLDDNTWYSQANYYDKYGRVIQTKKINQLSNYDRISTDYEFDGRVLAVAQEHFTSYMPGGLKVGERYVYDQAGRLLETYHQVQGHSEIMLSAMKYNEPGQMITKFLYAYDAAATNKYAMQQEDVRYNIRGWLTQMNDPENLGTDYFGYLLNYDVNLTDLGVSPQFNGNISGMKWRDSRINLKQGSTYSYDAINRLKNVGYKENTGSGYVNSTFKFNESGTDAGIKYDHNGNILTTSRYSETGSLLDNLVYNYSGNQLIGINDLGSRTTGFIDGQAGDPSNAGTPSTWEYKYNLNGGLKSDINAGITDIQYNYMNLPKTITKGSNTLQYTYDGSGLKIKNTSTTGTVTNYIGSFVYEGNSLKYILTSEGMIECQNATYMYSIFLKDHLGNTRLSFREGGLVNQVNNYYAFGMKFVSNTYNYQSIADQKYLYNGKELESGFGVDWYDYGARFYDPQIARWTTIDPAIENGHNDYTPYAYVYNNPLLYLDPFGLDSAQRAAAIEKSEEYVNENPGNSWEAGGKGQPGENIDCSGMTSNCIIAGGEEDPVERPGAKGNGVKRTADAEKKVDFQDAQEGDLIVLDNAAKGKKAKPFGHIGIITGKIKDKDGKVIGFNFNDSGGDPDKGSSGPRHSSTTAGGNYWGNRITGIYKWDTKPEVATTNNAANSIPVTIKQGSFSLGNWIMQNTGSGTGANSVGQFLYNHGL